MYVFISFTYVYIQNLYVSTQNKYFYIQNIYVCNEYVLQQQGSVSPVLFPQSVKDVGLLVCWILDKNSFTHYCKRE